MLANEQKINRKELNNVCVFVFYKGIIYSEPIWIQDWNNSLLGHNFC